MARATSSLPVPLSPVINTGTSWLVTRPIALYTSRVRDNCPRSCLRRWDQTWNRRQWPAHAANYIQSTLDSTTQLMQVERLEQVIKGTLLHRLNGRIGPFGHRDKNHRNTSIDAADLLVNVNARLVGKTQVRRITSGTWPLIDSSPAEPGLSKSDMVRRRQKYLPHLLWNEPGVVIDQQYICHRTSLVVVNVIADQNGN